MKIETKAKYKNETIEERCERREQTREKSAALESEREEEGEGRETRENERRDWKKKKSHEPSANQWLNQMQSNSIDDIRCNIFL